MNRQRRVGDFTWLKLFFSYMNVRNRWRVISGKIVGRKLNHYLSFNTFDNTNYIYNKDMLFHLIECRYFSTPFISYESFFNFKLRWDKLYQFLCGECAEKPRRWTKHNSLTMLREALRAPLYFSPLLQWKHPWKFHVASPTKARREQDLLLIVGLRLRWRREITGILFQQGLRAVWHSIPRRLCLSSSHPQAVVVSQVKTSDLPSRGEALVNICTKTRNRVGEDEDEEEGGLETVSDGSLRDNQTKLWVRVV